MVVARRRPMKWRPRSVSADKAAEFAFLCDASKLPAHVREHEGISGRKFRFDLAWPESMVAVEIHGGAYTSGRHVTGSGFQKDREKVSLAQVDGWIVLEFTAQDVRDRPAYCIDLVRKAINRRATA